MPRPKATHGRPRYQSAARGACIRIGTGGAQEGASNVRAFWLTVAEAEQLRAELDAAIKRAKGLAISGLAPPEPPLANAAALPKAA